MLKSLFNKLNFSRDIRSNTEAVLMGIPATMFPASVAQYSVEKMQAAGNDTLAFGTHLFFTGLSSAVTLGFAALTVLSAYYAVSGLTKKYLAPKPNL